ncbi:MAG: hypothetical protein L6Q33_07850 [Bacteriovoracaceae bacterium]|nr:hypothetical protein [Bacteriovoracaceae bacterium]
MKIQILVDNLSSWILPYTTQLSNELKLLGHDTQLIHNHQEISHSDILFLLGCEKIIKQNHLDQSRYPVVVHESDLPKGKGWSPLTWQILEGKKNIKITLLRAVEKVDSGEIYLQEEMNFFGHELNEELKHIQGLYTLKLCLNFAVNLEKITPSKQAGEESFFPKRIPKDSQLDPHKSIIEQFNLLRVCDNERYPAFFEHEGTTYIIKIFKK